MQPENYENINETLEIDVKNPERYSSEVEAKICRSYISSEVYVPLEVEVNHLLVIKVYNMSVQTSMPLARSNEDGVRPDASSQNVPAYSGMQSRIFPLPNKSKPYFRSPDDEQPKQSVINDVLVKTIEEKITSFAFLTGDMPTYKLITELKADNPNIFANIIPIIGASHQQMSFMPSTNGSVGEVLLLVLKRIDLERRALYFIVEGSINFQTVTECTDIE